MYYIVRDVTGAAITYERVGKAFFEEGAANCMAKEISKKGGQPLRVVNSAEYRKLLQRAGFAKYVARQAFLCSKRLGNA